MLYRLAVRLDGGETLYAPFKTVIGGDEFGVNRDRDELGEDIAEIFHNGFRKDASSVPFFIAPAAVWSIHIEHM